MRRKEEVSRSVFESVHASKFFRRTLKATRSILGARPQEKNTESNQKSQSTPSEYRVECAAVLWPCQGRKVVTESPATPTAGKVRRNPRAEDGAEAYPPMAAPCLSASGPAGAEGRRIGVKDRGSPASFSATTSMAARPIRGRGHERRIRESSQGSQSTADGDRVERAGLIGPGGVNDSRPS
jgi:hypothetical protein